MTGTNQKLREVLQEMIDMMDSGAEHGAGSPWYLDAKASLALPTADHIPDAGKMIETAAPVGERAKFDAWKKTMQNGFDEWDAWQAALSAGDVVDGQSNASRWVASADRYPPEGERVFFMDLATNIVGFDMWAGEGFMWMPSHWMPIPPAPAMRKGQL